MSAKPPYLPLPKAKRTRFNDESSPFKCSNQDDDKITRIQTIGDTIIPSDYRSLIIFDATLCQQVNAPDVRLPPQYVGMRRIRPSCKSIRQVLLNKKQQKFQEDFSWIQQHHDIQQLFETHPAFSINPTNNLSCGVDKSTDAASIAENSLPTAISDTQKDEINESITLTMDQKNAEENLTVEQGSNQDSYCGDPANNNPRSLLTYKVIDEVTGIERRMTSQEKRLFKLKISNEKKMFKKKCTKMKVELLEKHQKEKKIQNKIRKKKLLLQKQEEKIQASPAWDPDSMPIDPKHQIMRRNSNSAVDSSHAFNVVIEDATSSDVLTSIGSLENDERQEKVVSVPTWHQQSHNSPEQQRQYVHLNINQAAMEQELADLRGDRDGVPPVVLPFPLVNMALKYQKSLFFSNESKNGSQIENQGWPNNQNLPTNVKEEIILDDKLATRWVRQLKHSISIAEQLRQMEKNTRPMPYKLTPEVWARLRPIKLGTTSIQHDVAEMPNDFGLLPQQSSFDNNDTKLLSEETANDKATSNSIASSGGDDIIIKKEVSDDVIMPKKSWNWCQIRSWKDSPKQKIFDATTKIVVEMLYKDTNLHIACGSKFGCDYLLYDGPRNERHAFAGLRILPFPTANQPETKRLTSNKDDNKRKDTKYLLFPQQNPYELSGYVRCLNTAGKLALLATVYSDSIVSELNTKNVASDTPSITIDEKAKIVQSEKHDKTRYPSNIVDKSSCELMKKIIHRVAIIDLALEKVLSTTVSRPKKTLALRLQQLSKKS